MSHDSRTSWQASQPLEAIERESSSAADAVAGAQALLKREEGVRLREEVVRLREEAVESREQALRAQEEATNAIAELRGYSEAQLRDSNERLIVATVNAQTMAEAAEQTTAQMSHKAEHDFLTGLPNRSLLTDRLAQSILLAQRHRKKVALMYLDLDHFKQYNDSLGHAVGDHLLQSAAQRLYDSVRRSDTVSRQGGDEFVVLLAEVEQAQDAIVTAEKLIRAMAAPHSIDGHQLHVTLSIGISVYPDDGEDADALVLHADTAMYHVKRAGRNNYLRFTVDMNGRSVAPTTR